MGKKDAIIKKIGDAVEQQIIGFKKQIFKAYWRYQLRIEKFYERKCRKCRFVSYCFTEGLLKALHSISQIFNLIARTRE